MKLQRTMNRASKSKTYWRWTIRISPNIVDQLGWKPGEELDMRIDGTNLIVCARSQKSHSGVKNRR